VSRRTASRRRGTSRTRSAAALLIGGIAMLALAPRAGAATPATGTLTPSGGPVTWQGEFFAAGANVSNTAGDQLCSPSYPGGPDDPGAVPGVNQCDVFELKVNVPSAYWLTHSGGVRVQIEWGSADNDFDMYVYKKPPAGEPVGPPVASSAQGGTTEEHVIISRAQGTYLVRVNPFTVTNSDYDGEARLELREPIPDVPGGIAQSRASSTGFLSYSEPHISVDPLDPNHLVAGSKMYQNLDEYLFKIGTFASFDGGRTWKDNGHLPGYPKQTGDEGSDYHVTSDVWTAFDDEGNAYAMVLDSPPDSATGAGWGMNLHKSTDGGRTWSGPIPIESKNDPVTKQLLLADKNTLAVDNHGRDRNGKTGNIYACWSEDAPVANLAIRVSRSTDAGETWSTAPPVSGADRSVIGCYLVVGPPPMPGTPGVVYVFWLNFNDPASSTGASMRMAKSTDGGRTFSPPQTVVEIDPLPGAFPNSAFRNLSIPYAGVDQEDGTLYLTWSDYHRKLEDDLCPGEGDDADVPPGQVCDADILMVRSRNGGNSWSKPIRVNQDSVANGKDQFQPALAVTESGQLDMMWFDRRNDPQDFYIDTFFGRSSDGGKTWTETRVTRSMWDPSINPPISPSGEFIGDYQGMAANDCFAYPFWQDTTAANLSPQSPDFSPYQQVYSARIPNTARFGGTPVAGADCAGGAGPGPGPGPGPPPGPSGARCHGKPATISGTGGRDTLIGTRRRDVIAGLRRADSIKARKGNDAVCAGRGKDTIGGAKGKDKLRGGKGRDKLRGGKGKDRIIGGRRKDTIGGGKGKDKLRGGRGRDTIRAADGQKDKVRCGRGPDAARVDGKDVVAGNCEDVTLKQT
jgi:hypothetical protein